VSIVPNYRLVFADPQHLGDDFGGRRPDRTSDVIDSGDRVYAVGDLIEYDGRRWRVSRVPLIAPQLGAVADLLVWPAE
jgi:hypothetical protein